MIRFEAKLMSPADAGRAAWTFLVLPSRASARLPTRGMTTVEGTLNGRPFKANLEPDGRKSHWLKVSRKLREQAGAEPGDVVSLAIEPARVELEARVPPDLRKALEAHRAARAAWKDISPAARRDWIQWITTAKRPETRARRIANAGKMLAGGKRRVCCFDRSGFYGGGMRAPRAQGDPVG
jgi:hypothetical protein